MSSIVHLYDGYLLLSKNKRWSEYFCTLEFDKSLLQALVCVYKQYTSQTPVKKVVLSDKSRVLLQFATDGHVCIQIQTSLAHGIQEETVIRCSSNSILRQWHAKILSVIDLMKNTVRRSEANTANGSRGKVRTPGKSVKALDSGTTLDTFTSLDSNGALSRNHSTRHSKSHVSDENLPNNSLDGKGQYKSHKRSNKTFTNIRDGFYKDFENNDDEAAEREFFGLSPSSTPTSILTSENQIEEATHFNTMDPTGVSSRLPTHKVVCAFNAEGEEEMTCQTGDLVTVCEKHNNVYFVVQLFRHFLST